MLQREILRIATMGNVDDGKSTLIGRLLWDGKLLLEDQIEAIETASRSRGLGGLNLSLITDGLRAEREQGITIDVAYRHFSSARRKCIVADCPGHVQYTRNMITGVSTADLAVLLVDAARGVREQTRRHLAVSGLLHVPQVLVCINKMDLVGHSQARFTELKSEITALTQAFGLKNLHFVPVCALTGDNIIAPSARMAWHEGPSLMQFLETVDIGAPDSGRLRLPVQAALNGRTRAYLGTIRSGEIRLGDEVLIQPKGITSQVAKVLRLNVEVESAAAGDPVAVTLSDELDLERGDCLTHPATPAAVGQTLRATLCWLGDAAMQPQNKYLMMQSSSSTACRIRNLNWQLDISTIQRRPPAATISSNSIFNAELRLAKPVACDRFEESRTTGSFILIDEARGDTVAAGMIESCLP